MGARRILVVDDCIDTVDTLSALLEMYGHACKGVSTGSAAIAEAVGFAPEIVLLDLGLPDLSGFEVARELRACCPQGVYLAAMTAFDGDRYRELTRECGFDHYMRKPVSCETLRSLVEHARPIAFS